MEASKIRVLVVEDNSLLREGLCLLIQLQEDMELVVAAASAGEAVRLFRQHRPGVVLMDLDLPTAGAIAAIREMLQIDQAARIFGLLTHEWDESGTWALRAGARSCITKDRLSLDLPALVRG
jgi:DNA-binding NarL/FixJ family response regulator